nr:unnamed protein product [Callosobruchus analis]
MIFSQILGVLPQANICTNVNEIRFSWRSWKTVYTIFLIILSEFAVACCIIAWFKFGYALKNCTSLLLGFYFNADSAFTFSKALATINYILV